MFRSGRLRVAILAIADTVLLYTVWAVVTLSYHATGLGRYDPAFYLRMWPVGIAFVGINVLFRLYHGGVIYPAAPLSPVEELRRLAGSAALTHLGVIAVLALARQTTEASGAFRLLSREEGMSPAGSWRRLTTTPTSASGSSGNSRKTVCGMSWRRQGA